MSKSYCSNWWDWDYYWLFEGFSQSRVRNSKDENTSWNNGFKKENKGCFTCGDKNHLKRDCPKKANKKPPWIRPLCLRRMHWAKDCKSKFDVEGKPIPRNPKQGTPQGPLQQKPGINYIFFLKPSTYGSAAINIPALNDFFLYPQAVLSRILTRLFGPLPPQTFSLLFGQSSLSSKGITVHPGIIDLNYKGEIQIMMSSQILWQFKKGDKIAQLLLLPYISINSSNNVWTGRFSSTDQKQSLWTSLVSEYAWPNTNIKINNKRLKVCGGRSPKNPVGTLEGTA